MRSTVAAVLSFCSSGLTIGQNQYSFALFAVAINDSHPSWSRAAISSSFAVGQVVGSVVSPAVGLLLDKYGPRRIMPLCLLCVSIGFVVLSQTRAVWHMIAAESLMGLGFQGATGLGTGKVVGAHFPKKRGRVMGIVTAGNNAGGLVMSQLATALIASAGGFEVAALAFAALDLLFSAAIALLLRDGPAGATRDESPVVVRPEINGEGTDEALSEASAQPKRTPVLAAQVSEASVTLPEALRTLVFWSTATGMVCAFWTYPACLVNWYAALVAEGVAPSTATNMLSTVAAFGICSKLVCGRLSERATARRVLVLALLVQIVALVVFVLSNTNAGFWVASVLYGSSFGGVGALLPLLCIETFGRAHYGRIFGVIVFGTILPNLVGPVLAGRIFDVTGSYKQSLRVGVAVFALGAALLLQPLLCGARRRA